VSVHLTWLGQSGFLIEVGGLRILLDPFVSDHPDRLVPPPPLELVADGIDWLLVTHEHLDHLDLGFVEILASRSPGARIVLPAAVAADTPLPLPVEGVTAGERIELGAASVLTVPAVHKLEASDEYNDERFVGYVVDAPPTSIYHAGDTILTDELFASLRELRPTVCLLPVNGRDWFRERDGLVGNLDAREAVGLAASLGAPMLIPTHWDAFSGNTVDPETVVAEARRADAPLHVTVPRRLLPLDLGGRA
jgi:L-ascorbate metabolism protein UlaG (beta-lactamase superfamily)